MDEGKRVVLITHCLGAKQKLLGCPSTTHPVTPAKAGVQGHTKVGAVAWIPAFAGMTGTQAAEYKRRVVGQTPMLN